MDDRYVMSASEPTAGNESSPVSAAGEAPSPVSREEAGERDNFPRSTYGSFARRTRPDAWRTSS